MKAKLTLSAVILLLTACSASIGTPPTTSTTTYTTPSHVSSTTYSEPVSKTTVTKTNY